MSFTTLEVKIFFILLQFSHIFFSPYKHAQLIIVFSIIFSLFIYFFVFFICFLHYLDFFFPLRSKDFLPSIIIFSQSFLLLQTSMIFSIFILFYFVFFTCLLHYFDFFVLPAVNILLFLSLFSQSSL